MDKVIKNKKSLKLVTSCSSGHRTSSEKIPLLVIYYLTKFDDIFKAVFDLFQKFFQQIYANQFMTS